MEKTVTFIFLVYIVTEQIYIRLLFKFMVRLTFFDKTTSNFRTGLPIPAGSLDHQDNLLLDFLMHR